MDSLYVRIQVTPGAAGTAVQVLPYSIFWMTRVTLQGSGDAVTACTVCFSFVASDAQMFAEGMFLFLVADDHHA
jgi:hypothetical protein